MTIISQILHARDQRASYRKQFADNGFPSLSVSLNIAGYPKHNHSTKAFFAIIISDLKEYLKANGITILEQKEINITDNDGDFYIAPLSADSDVISIKQITEQYEANHPAGRVIDIDITTTTFEPISSGKRKKCIVCSNQAAVDCMRSQNHSVTEVREVTFNTIESFLLSHRDSFIKRELSSYLLKSILYEISLTPKPGLVDTANPGIHTDMNYYTFVNSTSILTTYFNDIIDLAINNKMAKLETVLPQIRYIGIKAERNMFDQTNGVNTQKGGVFLLGLSAYAAAYTVVNHGMFDVNMCADIIKTICADIVKNEIESGKAENSHGIDCYNKYGNKYGGARLEAQNGMSTAIKYGFNIFNRSGIEMNRNSNKKVLDTHLFAALLNIMANNCDSNILFRSNEEILEGFKNAAQKAYCRIKNGEEPQSALNHLTTYCNYHRISAGGAADLLSVAIFFYLCKQEFGKVN